MRQVIVQMLIGFGDDMGTCDFTLTVPDDWEPTPENLSQIYSDFRSEATLDIEDVLHEDCGESLQDGDCSCSDDEGGE